MNIPERVDHIFKGLLQKGYVPERAVIAQILFLDQDYFVEQNIEITYTKQIKGDE